MLSSLTLPSPSLHVLRERPMIYRLELTLTQPLILTQSYVLVQECRFTNAGGK